MNNFENPNFEDPRKSSRFDEAEKINENREESLENDLNRENDEEIIEKTPEENFVDIEEGLEDINNTLLEELSPEKREQLEQNKIMLEEQLQQEANFLVEEEKTVIEEKLKEEIHEKLIEEIQQLEKEGKLDNLVQELAKDKPTETDTEGPLKEIAKKDPKTAFEIIDKYLKGAQNLLESIKFGYDVATVLLEKLFKEKKEEEEKEKGSDPPSIFTPDQSPSKEEPKEKRDIFQELAQQRVSEQIEEEREIRREQREEESASASQNFNKEENLTNGGGPQQTGSQPST